MVLPLNHRPRTWVLGLSVALLGNLVALAAGPVDAAADRAGLHQTLEWIRMPTVQRARYDYVMTVKVRLLFFWIKRDDVGGGYIRRSVSRADPNLELIEVLFGSDPAKAPRGINRWGAGTEVVRRAAGDGRLAQASGFIGFMKKSKGESVSEMKEELAAERAGGRHLFQAIVSRVDPHQAVSQVVPFYSERDFNLHQLEAAQQLVLERFSDGPLRRLEGEPRETCGATLGFLATLQQLIDLALEGARAPLSRCYIYNARTYSATLERLSPKKEEKVKIQYRPSGREVRRTYQDLLEARFKIRRQESGDSTSFEILLGTQGALRGVPVQIVHQPNFWFQVVLNLNP